MAHTTVSSPSPPNQPHPLPKPPHLPLLPRLLASEPVEAVFGRDFPFVASSQRSDPLNYNFVTPSRKPTCLLFFSSLSRSRYLPNRSGGCIKGSGHFMFPNGSVLFLLEADPSFSYL
ncbi:hypothetical protein H4Q26_017888 [Puccinia striiformis f. sp. tritici PST-130]|nr:hypothetical protein H4Q26_017888 [Puccinia striiformis f. sp. tritici PST-130]